MLRIWVPPTQTADPIGEEAQLDVMMDLASNDLE